jgi:hypothetical protein
MAIGMLLGWALIPRPIAPVHIWLVHFAGLIAAILIATYITLANAGFAFIGAAVGASLRVLMLGALFQRRAR